MNEKMVFKSDKKEYWKTIGTQLDENITIVSEELEIKGYVKKEPIHIDSCDYLKAKFVYNVHLITENRLLAKQFFFNGDDIIIDGIKFYRGMVEQKPQIVRPANDIDYIFDFQYLSYDTFD